MATTKTITIQTDGQLNSTAITVVVLFEPVGAYKTFDPIVWQVGSWQPTGEQSMEPFTWTSNYAFSALSDPEDVDRPIKNGQQTSLQKDPNSVYYWTDPTPIAGHPGSNPVAWNMTGWKTNIGFGFIVNPGSIQQVMENVIVYENVADQKSVTASFSPSLSVYIFKTADLVSSYEEGQRLSSPLPASAKRWSKDLRTLDPTTADLTLGVAYNPITRKYDVTQDDGFGAEGLSLSEAQCGYPALARVLNATVCFDKCTDVSSALRAVSESLGRQGFTVDIVDHGCGSYSGEVQLTLPRSMSCNDAEFMLNNTIGFPGSKITEISGRYLISKDNVYVDINPASREWYDCWVQPLPRTGCDFVVQDDEEYKKAVKDAVEGVVAATESLSLNGNGNAAPVNGNGNARVMPARKATLGSRPAASEIFASA